ncbi:hypothetical protein IOC57_17405 [Bacillus sp. SD075]|uniref:hypothetical protein n=1 Tax=Bacillus sp. SD075 TaxID=2781732 RepID=UPI002570EA08|nr:hypothetical protein [Bacillus sp. SD075]MBO0999513.1 hypothetical protein [Bacillus sp. SD075]
MEVSAKDIVGGSGKPEGLNEGLYVKSTLFTDVTNEMTIICTVIILPFVHAI